MNTIPCSQYHSQYINRAIVGLCDQSWISYNQREDNSWIIDRNTKSMIFYEISMCILDEDLLVPLETHVSALDIGNIEEWKLVRAYHPKTRKSIEYFVNNCYMDTPYHLKHDRIAKVFNTAMLNPTIATNIYEKAVQLKNSKNPQQNAQMSLPVGS